VYTAKGCPECLETGYQGQTAIFEVLKLDKYLRQSWYTEPPISAFQLRQTLSDMLLDTLKRQALRKLREGVTSPEEIRRTVFRK
jgi:type II secretory ATPase GspE/PulE/Tfp pilus assembly ATPase PilB-like protein